MSAQISFPFETELTVYNPTGDDEVIILEAGEVLDVVTIQRGQNDTWDIYLGDFRCIFGVPGNFTYNL